MEEPIEKGEQLFQGDGWQVWATNQAGLALVEWSDEHLCEVAFRLQALLKRHALALNFVERLGSRSLVVRRVEPLAASVVAEVAPGETAVTFIGSDGASLSPEELRKAEGLKPDRIEMMEDAAAHAARSLRAYLKGPLRIQLHFGRTDEGECLLQVVNPMECDLGTTDWETLADQLGGEAR